VAEVESERRQGIKRSREPGRAGESAAGRNIWLPRGAGQRRRAQRTRTGPWQPVAAANELVQQASTSTPSARRLPNTGSFAWRVPAGLPPRVYLKVVARDSAGNEKTVITRDAVLIDLVKPRAKVSGIVGPAGSPRP
jgi:hypothetical protein